MARPAAVPKPAAGRGRRLLWFAGLWLGGVAAVAAVAGLVRWALPG